MHEVSGDRSRCFCHAWNESVYASKETQQTGLWVSSWCLVPDLQGHRVIIELSARSVLSMTVLARIGVPFSEHELLWEPRPLPNCFMYISFGPPWYLCLHAVSSVRQHSNILKVMIVSKILWELTTRTPCELPASSGKWKCLGSPKGLSATDSLSLI